MRLECLKPCLSCVHAHKNTNTQARGGAVTPTRTSRRVAAAQLPSSYHPDSGSAKKRRHRRLFEELQQQGLAGEDGYEAYGGPYGYGGPAYSNQQWSDEEGGGGAAAAAGDGGGSSRYNRPREIEDDDVGEGVDALLSLASLAHASSSCQTDSQAAGAGDDAGGAAAGGRSRSVGRSRPGRSGSLKRAGSGRAAAGEGGEEDGEEGAGDGEGGGQQRKAGEGGDDYWGAFEAAAAAVEAAERAKSQGDGSSSDLDADEAAAGGLAQMSRSQGGFYSTPQKRTGSGALQELFYRTGTPGGRAEYLLASPSDRPPLGLPSPTGSRGRRGPPKSPGGRLRGISGKGAGGGGAAAAAASSGGRRAKAARGAAGRAAAAAARAAAAATSQGSSGQRGGTVGRAAAAAAAAEGMDLDGLGADGEGGAGGRAERGGLLVSESELLSDGEHDYMEGGLPMPGEDGGVFVCLGVHACVWVWEREQGTACV